MMRRISSLALALTLSLPAAASAQQVITFDDLGTSCGAFIPNGYAGFNWQNFSHLTSDACGSNIANSGYGAGTVSGRNVAFNAFANPASMLMASVNPFTFNSIYMTAAWNDGVTVVVRGFQGATLLHTQTLTVSSHNPTLYAFNWAGITSVSFASSGGVNQGYGGSGSHIAFDNMTVNANVVPEPASMLLIGTGLAGVAAARRRRKNKTA